MLISELLAGALNKTALVRSSGEEVSYRALNEAVLRGAAALAQARIGPGSTVGLSAADPAHFLAGALAVWHSGAAVVPLDVRAGSKWVEHAIITAAVAAVISEAADDLTPILHLREVTNVVPHSAGMVLFTSGTSGTPKGVVLSRAGILANVDAILRYLPIQQYGRTAIVLPLSYCYALVGQALTTLRAGGTVLLLGDLSFPSQQLEAINRLDANGLSSVPTSLGMICRAAESCAQPLASLGYVASAGGPLDASTTGQVRRTFPGARIYNQYGLTEASPRVAAISDSDPEFARGSVGRPLAGIEVRVGAEGELYVRGPSVMIGYLGDPAATSRALSPDGWLRTGDAGYIDRDGRIFVSGRVDGVVKVAGERISVEEVAAALRGTPAVTQVEVVPVADDITGVRLVAFAVGPDSIVALLNHVARQSLSPAKRPAKIFAIEAMPLTSNGKIDFQTLRALAASRR